MCVVNIWSLLKARHSIKLNSDIFFGDMLILFQVLSGWCEEKACHSTETPLRKAICMSSLMSSSHKTTGSALRSLWYDIYHSSLNSVVVWHITVKNVRSNLDYHCLFSWQSCIFNDIWTQSNECRTINSKVTQQHLLLNWKYKLIINYFVLNISNNVINKCSLIQYCL